MPDFPRDLPHFYKNGGAEAAPYTRPPGGGGDSPPNPQRDREAHARALEAELRAAFTAGDAALENRVTHVADDEPGYYVEVRLPAGEEAVLQSLENRRQNIELLAARATDDDQLVATLFVPTRTADRMIRKVEAYRTKEDSRSGRPRNERLVTRMEAAKLADLRSLFVGAADEFPAANRQVWWEVWIRGGRLDVFNAAAEQLQVRLSRHVLEFPGREVRLALASPEELSRLMYESLAFAEVRLARDVPAFFLDLPIQEQAAWAEDLRNQLGPIETDSVVTVLDGGVNRGHPLLRDLLTEDDQHTVQPAWGVSDDSAAHWRGHGTGMAGLAALGDLSSILGTNRVVRRTHRLESVKILPQTGENPPELYGALTEEAVARVEVQAPARRRVICIATSEEANDAGVPSSWSASLDKIAHGGDGEAPRLVVVAAGNMLDVTPAGYIDANEIAGIQSPAQAWNALTVGAYTERVNVVDPDARHCPPLAEAGDLCPTSRTSVAWDRAWPSKPDVVLEGGNYVIDGAYAFSHDDLYLLTTNNEFATHLFRSFGATSAASALAAQMAGRITAELPNAWPETVRALIVHSAEWTPAMLRRAGARSREDIRALSLKSKQNLVRRFGYGVPDLERALYSARNDLTLVVQDSLFPYERGPSGVRTREMHLHALPWPRDVLLALGEVQVEMRVTLSYFVEPRPGDRGWRHRYQYASHGLRFEAKHPLETDQQFRARLSDAERAEGFDVIRPGDADRWDLHTKVRNSGSIHSDTWRGTASDLALRDSIGVFPVGGWWKEDSRMGRYDNPARYALVVSIRAPEEEIDLYAAVETEIQTRLGVAAEVRIEQ